ncbi:MAG: DEAD/DEAH box helicase [Phycisphaerales bacterium]|jgi:ATP-dependent RNA helicase RhlE|nr:DEAD/DEAH box helicase [Phycisphaerales bacterium]
MRFSELRLSEPIVRAVTAEGYETATPIQIKATPEVLAGRDVLGCAQTGTGKTAAFALPMLHQLAATSTKRSKRPEVRPHGKGTRRRANPGRPRALVLAPTRELASQIFESFCTYGRHVRVRHVVVFGGVKQASQVRSLRAGCDVLIATPGRLLDLINQGHIDLRGVETLVLDEADRMLDMGFIHDIRKVVATVPAARQTLLFSATMPREIRDLADSLLNDPVFMETAPTASPAEAVAQSVYLVMRQNKPALLQRVLEQPDMGRALIFTRTKHGADRVVTQLGRGGVQAGAIHSNKSQNARTQALKGFKSGQVQVLVATDIASRGIDVDEITHVINYDLPNLPDTYVHRIGRTARAGASGVALSFCDHEEIKHLKAIERLIRMEIEVREDESDLQFNPSKTRKTRPQNRDNRTDGKPSHWNTRRSKSGRGAKPGGWKRQSKRRKQAVA